MMRAIWTDEDGDEIGLADEVDGDYAGRLGLLRKDEILFAFSGDDAESFAAYLRAWALKQREGV